MVSTGFVIMILSILTPCDSSSIQLRTEGNCWLREMTLADGMFFGHFGS